MMRPTLATDKSIDTPPAHQPDRRASGVEDAIERNDVVSEHLPPATAYDARYPQSPPNDFQPVFA